MSTKLVILGLLQKQQLYGYEIKQIIEEHMSDWTNIAFGSIYFALSKLAEDGMIEKVATEKEGNRPSRSVYQITESGRQEFLQLLRDAWSDLERQYFTIDVALSFSKALPLQEVEGYLRQRVEQLEAILQHIDAHQTEQLERREVPPAAAYVFEHSRVHFQAELGWTRDLLEKVKQGLF
ncbi:MAG: PadR family transcriptional regulator [Anaerolineales bacterium]|nr:PadR family transcriptional regulator [Anaerolineales bacterium]